MKRNEPVTQIEQTYSEDWHLISTTDLKGRITYANKNFCAVSGFDLAELEGKPHNIVRHPDMPPAVFADLWSNLKQGRSWMGIIKNRCKNGNHYWVDAFVTPIQSGTGTLEYQSIRTKPNADRIKRAERLYQQLNQKRRSRRLRWPRLRLPVRLLLGAALALVPLALLATLQGPTLPALATTLLSFLLTAAVILWGLRPLGSLLREARGIVSNADMLWIYTGRTDEFGEIQLAITMQNSQLRAVVGRVLDASQQAESVVHQSAQHAMQASQNSEAQQLQAEQAAQAMHEVSGSIQDMAHNTSMAAEAAQSAQEISQRGNQVLEQSMATIRGLAEQLEQAAAQIRELRTQGDQIVEVVNVIGDIAEQTNLLALNAAIEAARAGEQGRGFAVVADEVRALASRTQASTHEIQAMVQAIQQGTQQAVTLIAEGERQSELCVHQGEDVTAAFSGISQQIAAITDMNHQIATAVEEQSVIVADVSQRLSEVSTIAQDNTLMVQESAQLGQQAEAQLGQQLKLIQQFLRRTS